MDLKTAKAAFDRARLYVGRTPNHTPGHIFRVPGYPGIWSDGMVWVIDVNGGQDWRLVNGKWMKAVYRI